jgi:uncharacterized protein Yka (UPF0111/DUF47 family)
MPRITPPSEHAFVAADVLDRFGTTIAATVACLRELVREPDREERAHRLVELEHEGDGLAHDLIHLVAVDPTAAPFSAGDAHRLATALDDVIDYAEDAGSTLLIYRVAAPMEQALRLSDILVAAAEAAAACLGAFLRGGELAPFLADIHRIEEHGDRVGRAAVAELFVDGIDPMVVIRWKDIYDALEQAIDACERVAHLIEGIALGTRTRTPEGS